MSLADISNASRMLPASSWVWWRRGFLPDHHLARQCAQGTWLRRSNLRRSVPIPMKPLHKLPPWVTLITGLAGGALFAFAGAALVDLPLALKAGLFVAIVLALASLF